MNSEDFYFNVDIWGTVSDWIMVLVTVLTALFLILTFKQQQKLFKNELYKYRLFIKPSFNAKIIELKRILSTKSDHITAVIELEVQNHKLFLEKIVIRTEKIVNNEEDFTILFPKRNLEVGATFPCLLQYFEMQNDENYKLLVSPEILIFFSDIQGNTYQQQLNLITKPEETLYVHIRQERDNYIFNKFSK